MHRIFIRRLALALLSGSLLCMGPASAAIEYSEQCGIGRELKLPVHQWVDYSKPSKGIVVANHGLVFTGRAYDSLARYLADNGYTVFAQDFRGFGAWVTKVDEFGGDAGVHFTQTKEDMTRLLSTLRKTYPQKKIYLIGESLGANYSIWQASTEPHLIDGVIATSTCFQLRVHPRALWVLTGLQGLSNPKRPLNIAPYLEPILSDDRNLTKQCLKDPAVTTRLSATDLIKAWVTNKYTLRELEAIPADMPVMLIAGKRDGIGNSKRVKTIVPRIGSKKVRVVELSDRGHLLLENQPVDPEIGSTIVRWLDEHSKNVSLVTQR